MKYMYTSCWRLRVGVINNVVEATTEAASSSGERQSTRRWCEKIFGHKHWQQGATLHKALTAKGQTREATSYFCRTILSDLGDQKKCNEARPTGFLVHTPSV